MDLREVTLNTIQLVRRVGAAAVTAALLAAPAASAADKPVPCNGKLLATDPAGDAYVGFVGLAETPAPAGRCDGQWAPP